MSEDLKIYTLDPNTGAATFVADVTGTDFFFWGLAPDLTPIPATLPLFATGLGFWPARLPQETAFNSSARRSCLNAPMMAAVRQACLRLRLAPPGSRGAGRTAVPFCLPGLFRR